MKLKVNGEIKELKIEGGPTSLSSIIRLLVTHPDLVVVELNGSIVSNDLWKEQSINDGDVIEIVTIVGGGS